MGIKEALALGMELSSFFVISYLASPGLAKSLGFDENHTLAALLALSLIVWTAHAFIYFEKRG